MAKSQWDENEAGKTFFHLFTFEKKFASANTYSKTQKDFPFSVGRKEVGDEWKERGLLQLLFILR